MRSVVLEANAIGRSSKTVREFLEKNHKDDLTRDESIKLTVKSLLEVVQTGAKNIEISVMESYGKVTVSLSFSSTYIFISDCFVCILKNLDLSQIEAIVAEIEREKEAGELLLCLRIKFVIVDDFCKRRKGNAQGWRPLLLGKQLWHHDQRKKLPDSSFVMFVAIIICQ